jgi:2Fe-2S ferredoxin
MITVNFVRNGETIPVKVEEGTTLMEAAKHFAPVNIDEIAGDCGGSCACATCHVYIDNTWVKKIEGADPARGEIELLEYDQNYKKDTSRLACQIILGKEHNGLIAHLITEKSQ